jgi:predicted Fe-S protein YdhL (DUF1289 family)
MNSPKLGEEFRISVSDSCTTTLMLACRFPLLSAERATLMAAWQLLADERRAQTLTYCDERDDREAREDAERKARYAAEDARFSAQPAAQPAAQQSAQKVAA